MNNMKLKGYVTLLICYLFKKTQTSFASIEFKINGTVWLGTETISCHQWQTMARMEMN